MEFCTSLMLLIVGWVSFQYFSYLLINSLDNVVCTCSSLHHFYNSPASASSSVPRRHPATPAETKVKKGQEGKEKEIRLLISNEDLLHEIFQPILFFPPSVSHLGGTLSKSLSNLAAKSSLSSSFPSSSTPRVRGG